MRIESYWYRDSLHPLLLPLLPLSLAFGLITRYRRWSYRLGIQKTRHFSIPIIVVGNISIGGTGKTPLVITLAQYLKEQGKKPGIALRGCGGKQSQQPVWVTADSDPFVVGDEAVLLAKNTGCPVAVCVDRPAAVQALQDAACDLVLCDDGLQHYRLARQLEIAVIDGSRYFGNGWLLPAGPLREPVTRLAEVDFIVTHSPATTGTTHPISENKPHFSMQLHPDAFQAVHKPTPAVTLSTFSGRTVHAIAGIGNPSRFFDLLKHLGINVIPHPFPDHHRYQSSDLYFPDTLPIVMTEKDAIKCKTLAFTDTVQDKQWFLRVTAAVNPALKQALLNKIEERGKKP